MFYSLCYIITCSEPKFTTVIIFSNNWFDIMVTVIRYSVHMCDESNRRFVLQTCGSRKLAIQITLVIQNNIRQSKIFHFRFQKSCKIELAYRRWYSFAVFVTWCADNNIIQ